MLLLLLRVVHAEQVWVSPSVSLEEAAEAVSRLGISDAPRPLAELSDRFSLVLLHPRSAACPAPADAADIRAAVDEAQARLQRLDIPGASSLAESATDRLPCLAQPAPPELLFAASLAAAEVASLALQADPDPRHRAALTAALAAAAARDGTPPISLDPELSRELLRIRRSLGVGTVRAAGTGEVYLDGRRLADAPRAVREGSHLVQLVVGGTVSAAEEIEVVEGTAILLWSAPDHAASAGWQIEAGVEALERTGQTHMMLGPALSASDTGAVLLVTRSDGGVVVWSLEDDRLHRRLQTDAPASGGERILQEQPYGIRFVGLAGQWLGEPGLGGGLTGWVALSERARLSLSLAAASATAADSSDGQGAGMLPVTLGLRRRGAAWELGGEVGGAYTIRLSDDPFRPMAGLVGAISLPPTTAAAAHLQLSGGWQEGGGYVALSLGLGLR